MPRTLLIDDLKDIQADRVARNYADGIKALQEEHWDVLYLDHDLGDFSGPGGRELDGNSVMCWLEQNPQHLPGEVIIVSRNPVGRQRIASMIWKLYGIRVF